MQHIILIGGMGSGKTSVGRRLSSVTGLPHIDLDQAIEDHTNLSITEIFKRHGEPYFRDIESQVLKDATSLPVPHILSTGGGIVVRDQNSDSLLNRGFVVYLDTEIETQIERLKHESLQRPLLAQTPDLFNTLTQLKRQRDAKYRAWADYHIVTDQCAVHALALEIEKAYNAWLKSTAKRVL